MTYLGFRSTEGEGEMGERPGLRDGALDEVIWLICDGEIGPISSVKRQHGLYLVWGWEGWVVGGWGEVGREGAAL